MARTARAASVAWREGAVAPAAAARLRWGDEGTGERRTLWRSAAHCGA